MSQQQFSKIRGMLPNWSAYVSSVNALFLQVRLTQPPNWIWRFLHTVILSCTEDVKAVLKPKWEQFDRQKTLYVNAQQSKGFDRMTRTTYRTQALYDYLDSKIDIIWDELNRVWDEKGYKELESHRSTLKDFPDD